MLKINPAYQKKFQSKGLIHFDQWMAFSQGKVFKSNKHRSVIKFSVQDEKGEGHDFFLKKHMRPEIKDKIKDLLSLHWPLSDSKQEQMNIQKVAQLGIATMKPVGFGEKKGFLRQPSFLITESLGDLERLEDYLVHQFASPLPAALISKKRLLIQKVAKLARDFHGARLCHRDFYCGHILVKEMPKEPILYLIDLQRVRQHRFLRRRWKTKDLAALNYTASPKAISKTDRLRFFFSYLNLPFSTRLTSSHKRWIRQILRRTARIEQHTAKKRKKYLRFC